MPRKLLTLCLAAAALALAHASGLNPPHGV